METIEITLAEFKELHRKAVIYDIMKKEYDRSKYPTTTEEVLFATEPKEISLDFIGGEK